MIQVFRMLNNRALGTLILLIIVTVPLIGCDGQQSAETVSGTRFLLDTVCTITIFGTRDRAILDEAFDFLSRSRRLRLR
jgi:hypothetical protein